MWKEDILVRLCLRKILHLPGGDWSNPRVEEQNPTKGGPQQARQEVLAAWRLEPGKWQSGWREVYRLETVWTRFGILCTCVWVWGVCVVSLRF